MNTKKTVDKLEESLGVFAEKVNGNIYITSIRDAMLAYMPFTVIASFFLIIAFFPYQPVIDLITKMLGTENPWVWQSKLIYVNDSTLAIGGLYVVISMSKSLADKLKTNALQCILTAVGAFLVLTPLNNVEGTNFLDITRISAQAMFLAIIVGIGSTVIYKKLEDKNIKIKLPDSVPPAVSGPFESIIPTFFVILIALTIRIALELGFDSYAVKLINGIFAAPLSYIGSSVFGMIIIRLVENSLWFFGLHGSSIVGAVTDPIFQVLEDQNKIATLAGQIPHNIISYNFKIHFAGVGWIGVCFALAIIAKSKQYKEVAKISLPPHLFNIGEPTLFGVPLMLNFSYVIPFLFSNTVSIIIAYCAFFFKLVPVSTGLAQVPWTTPPLISGYLVTGSIAGSILQLVLIVVSTLIWIPFVRVSDKKLCVQEHSQENS
jgi:PTS system cellobiose-specific IIC component